MPHCHHVAPIPEFSNNINSTCFNYTWDINIHEPIDTTGVKVLLEQLFNIQLYLTVLDITY